LKSLNSTRTSSRDEIANVNCFTTTFDTYYKVQ